MTRLLSAILLVLASACTSFGASDWTTLFSGKNLKGWVVPEGNKKSGWYKAVNKELRIQSGPEQKGSILWTKKSFKDFEIELEFQFGEGVVDTGVHLRNMDQIQIGISGSLKRDMTGSPYIPKKGYPVEAKGVSELLKSEDWNAMKIRAVGNDYTVWLNGKRVMNYNSETAIESGPVGLQLHGKRDMSVKYRNIRLRKVSKPNVLLICIDDLRPELKSFGMDYIHSPNIDAVAARGRAFTRHYVQAPTCGASRYTLLTGRYGSAGNDALFKRAKTLASSSDEIPSSMPAWFRKHGYTTVSVGKVSHHPGGRGGSDWDDESIPEMPESWDRHILEAGAWQHPRGWMHGLGKGEIRGNASKMDVIQALDGPDTDYPDGINTKVALRELDFLAAEADEKPFFMAFGILRPHLPFGAPKKYLDLYRDATLPPVAHPEKPEGKTTWHGSGEFYKYNRWGKDPNKDADFALEVRKHYAACVSFADAQVGHILNRLQMHGLEDNTVVVIWGDHGWHLGEHSIWGKHALFEESLHSPLIISYPGMPSAGEQAAGIVETLDVFPTLVGLTGIEKPEHAQGVSLKPMLESPDAAGHPAFSYRRDMTTIRTESHRMILHGKGHVELYDHREPNGETRNLATKEAKTVERLKKLIEDRFE